MHKQIDSSNQYIITIDTDWAPDFVLRHVAEILLENKVKATWFITHDSPFIREIATIKEFERGIHPNFNNKPVNEDTYRKVIDDMMKIVPEAVSTRSHGVFQSGSLLHYYATKTDILIDSTTFLPETEHLKPVKQIFPQGELIRMPFFWADDYEMSKRFPLFSFSESIAIEGMKILVFHPIHVYLNTTNHAYYAEVKSKFSKILTVEESDLLSLKNHEKGVFDYFMESVNYIANQRKSYTLKEYFHIQ